mgnify:CR=1 FL=1
MLGGLGVFDEVGDFVCEGHGAGYFEASCFDECCVVGEVPVYAAHGSFVGVVVEVECVVWGGDGGRVGGGCADGVGAGCGFVDVGFEVHEGSPLCRVGFGFNYVFVSTLHCLLKNEEYRKPTAIVTTTVGLMLCGKLMPFYDELGRFQLR